jgi:F-type H+-transporting ATPase subunit delta
MQEDKEAIIAEALKLLKSDEKEIVADILTKSIDETVQEIEGTAVAFVESATGLTPHEKTRLEQSLTKKFGRELAINYQVNKHLLGGFRVRVGDWKLDTTLVSQLEQMKQQLRGGQSG